MNWTVIIPLNTPARRKSRLAGALSPAQREALAEELYRHVLGCTGAFSRVVTLSPAPCAGLIQEHPDLNADLMRVRTLLSTRMLVLNADLPLLTATDLRALVEAAESAGVAVAADRHGTGTNAVALLPNAAFQFAFGPGSLAAHLRATPHANVVLRRGLACDLDTPADIEHLIAMGCSLRVERPKWAHVD